MLIKAIDKLIIYAKKCQNYDVDTLDWKESNTGFTLFMPLLKITFFGV